MTSIPAFCYRDSTVQSSAARLQTVLVVIMGLLSAMSSGWWGQWGDRVGRTKVILICTFGLAAWSVAVWNWQARD